MSTLPGLVFVAGLSAGCTSSPSDLPPCLGVYSSASCPLPEAGTDGAVALDAAAEGSSVADDAESAQ